MASYALVESDRPLRTYEREKGNVGLMRFMITCRIPVEKGNELVKTGSLGPTVQSIMEDLQPEAAYFVDVDGARGAHARCRLTKLTFPRALQRPKTLFSLRCNACLWARTITASQGLSPGGHRTSGCFMLHPIRV